MSEQDARNRRRSNRRKMSVTVLLCVFCTVSATIDVNLSELEYLAARLDPFECRRLITALHFDGFDLPVNLAEAERNVDDEVPCFRHLLHWNGAEGRGGNHEKLGHRLRQIGRGDLADWLGLATFRQLGGDLNRVVEAGAFGELGKPETEIPRPVTLEPRAKEEDPWWQADVVLMAVLLGLIGSLVAIACTIMFHGVRRSLRRRRK